MTIQTTLRRLPGSAALSALLFASPFAAAFAEEPPLSRTSGDATLKWGACPDFMPKGCEIAVLQGDPAKNNADVFFRVPANAVIPRHWHSSAERMVLVAGELHVTYDGHETAVLKPGTYAYGPARLSHKAECAGAGPCVLFIAFESPVDVFASDDVRK